MSKFTSRKFIVTAISTIAGLITLFVGESEIVQTIASALMIIVPTVVYCIIEGNVDAKSVKSIKEAVVDTAEKLGASENTVEVIEKVGEIGEMLAENKSEE